MAKKRKRRVANVFEQEVYQRALARCSDLARPVLYNELRRMSVALSLGSTECSLKLVAVEIRRGGQLTSGSPKE